MVDDSNLVSNGVRPTRRTINDWTEGKPSILFETVRDHTEKERIGNSRNQARERGILLIFLKVNVSGNDIDIYSDYGVFVAREEQDPIPSPDGKDPTTGLDVLFSVDGMDEPKDINRFT